MALYVYIQRVDASQVEFMLEMYDDIDWMDEPTETGWMPAPEQVAKCEIQIQIQIDKYKYKYKCKYKYTTETGWMPAPEC